MSRCIALAQAIRRVSPRSKIHFLIHGDEKACQMIRTYRFSLDRFQWHRPEKVYDFARKCEGVILDSYLADRDHYERLSHLSHGRILMFDDELKVSHPPGVVVRPWPDISTHQTPSKHNHVAMLTGRKYILLKDEFNLTAEKRIRSSLSNILITLGGAKHNQILNQIIKAALNSSESTIYVVAPFFKLDRTKYDTGDRKRIHIYSCLNINKMRKLMFNADLCFSGGGQTLLELSRIGTPTVAVCLAKNQAHQIAAMKRNRSVEIMDLKQHDTLKAAMRKIKKLKHQNVRHLMSCRAKRYIKSYGADRVIRAFIRYLSHSRVSIRFRHATAADSRILWQWRNHKLVRKWCFDSSRIPWKLHQSWFQRALKDKGAKIYIAETSEIRNQIGQVRFNLESSRRVSININLRPNEIGKGLGSMVIREATKKFFAEHCGVDEVIAEVMKANSSSRRAFEIAGYSMWKYRSINGKPSYCYKMKRVSQ